MTRITPEYLRAEARHQERVRQERADFWFEAVIAFLSYIAPLVVMIGLLWLVMGCGAPRGHWIIRDQPDRRPGLTDMTWTQEVNAVAYRCSTKTAKYRHKGPEARFIALERCMEKNGMQWTGERPY